MNHGQRWKPAASVIGHDASVDKQKTADVNLAPWQKCTARACCDSVIILIKRHYSLVPWVDRVMRILERTELNGVAFDHSEGIFFIFGKDKLNRSYVVGDDRSNLNCFGFKEIKIIVIVSCYRIDSSVREKNGKHSIR